MVAPDIYDYMMNQIKPMGVGQPASEEVCAKFEGVLPSSLIRLWREIGFDGLNGGRAFLVNPEQWYGPVAQWLDGIELAMGPDTFHPYAYEAFGGMHLWGEKHGACLTIDPVFGFIVPAAANADSMGTEEEQNLMIQTGVMSVATRTELEDEYDKPLFERAVKKYGRLMPGQMYGFFPAYGIGGRLLLSNIEVVDAVTHVELLADLTERQVLGDITMSPFMKQRPPSSTT